MNVLVYNGPGVSQTSLQHTLSTLRTILTPNYTVQTISPHSVKSDPWSPNCALFVLPGGRDLPVVSSLKDSSSKIREYVQNGGSFLGLCAGAYYACSSVEWEVGTPMEVSGQRPLGFFKGVGKGCVYPGFQYETELGARAVSLKVKLSSGQEKTIEGLYYNGGGEFVAAQGMQGTSVIGEYLDGQGKGKIAGVLCEVGKGRVILWAVHPEYPLTLEPALSAIKSTSHSIIASDNLAYRESQRWDLMEDTLRTLGLQIPKDKPHHLTILPQFLTSTPYNEKAVNVLRDSEVAATIRDSPLSRITGHSDKFEIRNADDSEAFMEAMRSRPSDSSANEDPKQIIIYPDGVIPPKELTPHFNLAKYYANLETHLHHTQGQGTDNDVKVSMGEISLYGEVVTSTQTLLDKNPTMTTLLPTPLISIASFQLSGRGRGSNIWLSPSGCLQFSLLLRVSRLDLPPAKLVFIQYLFGLAVVEACNSDAILGNIGKQVRLKWPNDIYAAPDSPMGLKKIGGILVNTSFSGDLIDIVIGCGLNVLTRSPVTSLSHLVPPGVKVPELSMENTAAAVMAVFDKLWSEFLRSRGSFEPFMDSYLQNWLHSDQVVTLTTQDPHIPVRIVGITSDYGFLRTYPEQRDRWASQVETYIDLQPDGNSFDLMAGLIKTKQ